MKLTEIIKSVENQYKQNLEEFFISVYNEQSLLSHGIDHHRRVWNYAKEYLKLFPLIDTAHISKFTSELIIACYMHDIGMSVDPGVMHGKHSRKLCVQFLNKNNLPETNYNDALEAIEHHDNKDYIRNSFMNDLLTILSVSDDLDAFGYTGIFRYSEIYLTRVIDPEKIGYLIRENAERRFDNFIKTFGSFIGIVEKHTSRYKILDNFFRKYNEQLPSYHFGTTHPSGYCGVVEIIHILMKNSLQLKDFFAAPEKYSSDLLIRWFFEELEKELLCS